MPKPAILQRKRRSAPPDIPNTPITPINSRYLKTPTKSRSQTPQVSTPVIDKKPPYSYAALIEMALSSSKSYTMNLKDIYLWVETNFDYFKTAKSGWKNSIRHNLSLQKSFTRVDFLGNSSNQPSVWRLKIDENRKPLTYDSVKERETKISTPLKTRKNLNDSFGEKFSPVKGVLTPNRFHDSGNFSFSRKVVSKNRRKTMHSLLTDPVPSAHVLDVSSSSSSNCSPDKYIEAAAMLPQNHCKWIHNSSIDHFDFDSILQ